MLPAQSLESDVEGEFNHFFREILGSECIHKKKIGKGTPDAIIDFYNEKNKSVWGIIEYKRDKSKKSLEKAFAQQLLYVCNFYYDVNIRGFNNFAGIFIISKDYFVFIRRIDLIGVLNKFEYLWKKHFRQTPCDAYDDCPDIRAFVWEELPELLEKSIVIGRDDDNARLDVLIKGIYEEWNLL